MIFLLLEEQGWGSNPTSVARVQIPASTPYVGLLLVFSFAPSNHLASSPIMASEARRERTREIEAEEKGSSPFLPPPPPPPRASPIACCSRGLLATPPNGVIQEVFLRLLQFSPLLKKPTLPNSNSTRNNRRRTSLWMCYL